MVWLARAGLPAIHSPAFEIEPAAETTLDKRIRGLRDFDAVVVTSPVAARLIATRANDSNLEKPRFIAPGKGTASILEAAGLRCQIPATGGTSEAILAMPGLAEISGDRIAIVGAPGGRGLLACQLSGRAASVEKVHVYARRPLTPAPELIDALQMEKDLVVLISSRQAFAGITGALSGARRRVWLSSRFVVSSKRLANACSAAGASRVHRAAGAADELMLGAVAAAGWKNTVISRATTPDDFR